MSASSSAVRALALGVLLGGAVLEAGCTTLPRGRTADPAEDEFVGMDLTEAPETEEGGTGTPTRQPEGVDVTWEDNGVAIRQTSKGGKPRAMETPNSRANKRLVTTPPSR
jgi:hypothetical protein